MATRERIRTGVGQIAMPDPMSITSDGKVSEAAVSRLTSYLRDLARKINGFISLGDASASSWAGNLDAQYVSVTFPSVANTEIEIPHGLLRVVSGYEVVRKDRACDVYDSQAGSWTPSRVLLKCSIASASVVIRLW